VHVALNVAASRVTFAGSAPVEASAYAVKLASADPQSTPFATSAKYAGALGR